MASPWLTPTQAAAYLSLALGTVRNLTSARVLPFARRGRIVRYHRDALDRWLTKRACPGRAAVAGQMLDALGVPSSPARKRAEK